MAMFAALALGARSAHSLRRWGFAAVAVATILVPLLASCSCPLSPFRPRGGARPPLMKWPRSLDAGGGFGAQRSFVRLSRSARCSRQTRAD